MHADCKALLGAAVEESSRRKQHWTTLPTVDVVGVQVRRALDRNLRPHALHEHALCRDVAVMAVPNVAADVPHKLVHILADGVGRKVGIDAKAVEPQAVVERFIRFGKVVSHIGLRRVPGVAEARAAPLWMAARRVIDRRERRRVLSVGLRHGAPMASLDCDDRIGVLGGVKIGPVGQVNLGIVRHDLHDLHVLVAEAQPRNVLGHVPCVRVDDGHVISRGGRD